MALKFCFFRPLDKKTEISGVSVCPALNISFSAHAKRVAYNLKKVLQRSVAWQGPLRSSRLRHILTPASPSNYMLSASLLSANNCSKCPTRAQMSTTYSTTCIVTSCAKVITHQAMHTDPARQLITAKASRPRQTAHCSLHRTCSRCHSASGTTHVATSSSTCTRSSFSASSRFAVASASYYEGRSHSFARKWVGRKAPLGVTASAIRSWRSSSVMQSRS